MNITYKTIEEVVQQCTDLQLRQTNPLYLPCESLTPQQILTSEIQEFIGHMLAVMHRNGGVGIAANQVARNWQIFIVNVDPAKNERYKFDTTPFIDKVFINPQMTAHSETLIKFPHGCLSDQGEGSCQGLRRGWVATYEWIEYEALDNQAKRIVGRLSGVPAIVFQHELAHLRGYTYLDVATDYTRFDELSDQEKRPQSMQIHENIPVLLKSKPD